MAKLVITFVAAYLLVVSLTHGFNSQRNTTAEVKETTTESPKVTSSSENNEEDSQGSSQNTGSRSTEITTTTEADEEIESTDGTTTTTEDTVASTNVSSTSEPDTTEGNTTSSNSNSSDVDTATTPKSKVKDNDNTSQSTKSTKHGEHQKSTEKDDLKKVASGTTDSDETSTSTKSDVDTIKEMLGKLNVMMASYGNCKVQDDTKSAADNTTSDWQNDYGETTEDSNEITRTIEDIVQKLDGIVVGGSRCQGDNKINVAIGGKSRIHDWAFYDDFPELKIDMGFVDCTLVKYKKECAHIKESVPDGKCKCSYTHRVVPEVKIELKEDKSCQQPKDEGIPPPSPTPKPRQRKPCFDVTSPESVLSQMCQRLTSMEEEIDVLTSQRSFLRHQPKEPDMMSHLLNVLAQFKGDNIGTTASAFYASAHLAPGHIRNFAVKVNQGGRFDPSGGVFTVPVTGVYQILVSQENQNVNDNMTILVKVAGSSYAKLTSGNGGSMQSLNTLVHLETGKTVWLEASSRDAWPTDGSISFGAFKVV